MRTPGRDQDDDDFEDENRDSLTDVPGGVRLQKVLAEAGVGSRRHCEELIGAGRVEVDGEIVRRFGARVDPEHQVIRLDGKRIPAKPGLVYLAFNKPAGVLTAMSDPRGRKTVSDFLGDRSERPGATMHVFRATKPPCSRRNGPANWTIETPLISGSSG